MFDPFKDFATAGYLRNKYQEKDEQIIKRVEHEVFTRNLPRAIDYLSKQQTITYDNFLAVHALLFSEFYPWAGQDRLSVIPDGAVSKGRILFSHPQDVRRAIDEGLRVGQIADLMARKPGEVMGLFAYGHPFLDGNGRTMLLIHLELCYRAGFSIAWSGTDKARYLTALTQEIDNPGKGVLDRYLLQFKGERLERGQWGESILAMQGLDGLDKDINLDGDISDPGIAERYRQFEQQRSYSYRADGICEACGAVPCTCN
jgi:cell filamentation protein